MPTRLLTVCLVGLLASSSALADLPELEQWRQQRLARLTSETGWLTLVGLYWLRPGENTFGRASTNRIVLDHPSLPTTVGKFLVRDGRIQFEASAGARVTHDGKPVRSIALIPDSQGTPTTLAVGSLRFFIIERAGRLGVRVRDVDHPARKNFAGLEYFPARDDWIVDARFEPYPADRRIPILNILGMTEDMVAPGSIVFTKDGREFRLDAILEAPDDQELFIMFADATSGRETYGAGRYIYIPLPKDGRVTVDFNRAYNPPCAFNDFATCPLPPPQNRLPIRVEAGEKKYRGEH
ncbi:MAG TPA: DUF1684 domain-containing protein [Steroidobacteraceae bacterium]